MGEKIMCKLNGLKEMESMEFVKELDMLEGKYITVNVDGEISSLHNVESFNYYITTDVADIDWLVMEDENNPDEYILRIYLDAVTAYQKDMISDALLIVTESGMMIQLQEC